MTVSVGHCHPKVVPREQAGRHAPASDDDLPAPERRRVRQEARVEDAQATRRHLLREQRHRGERSRASHGARSRPATPTSSPCATPTTATTPTRRASPRSAPGSSTSPHSFGVHHAHRPDPYREPVQGHTPEEIARKYANDIRDLIATRRRARSPLHRGVHPGRRRHRRTREELPQGSVRDTSASTAALCIADEVQTGFGRTGDALLGLRELGRHPRLRHDGQGPRQRRADRRRHHAHGNRPVAHAAHPLQHVRRQPDEHAPPR